MHAVVLTYLLSLLYFVVIKLELFCELAYHYSCICVKFVIFITQVFQVHLL